MGLNMRFKLKIDLKFGFKSDLKFDLKFDFVTINSALIKKDLNMWFQF